MTKPNFTLLKQINDLLKEIQNLEKRVQDLKHEKQVLAEKHQRESENLKKHLGTDYKQRVTLEKIESEIQEIWSQEHHLRIQLHQALQGEVQSFFSGKGLTEYLEKFLKMLDKDNQKYTVIASKANSKLLPKGVKFEEVDKNLLRIRVDEIKEYIFDPQTLPNRVVDLIIKQELPLLVAQETA
jgi:DNA repair exonuclease SbcCD ATPase subunit